MTEHLSVKDLMKLFKVSKTTIYTLLKSGTFPKGAYFGRCHRWSADDVDNWAKAQAV